MKIKMVKNGTEVEVEVFKVYENEADYLADVSTEVEKGSKDLQTRIKEFELKEKDSNLTKELLNLGVKSTKVSIMKKLLTEDSDVKKQVNTLLKEHPEFKKDLSTNDEAEANGVEKPPKEKSLADRIIENKDELLLKTI